MYIVWFETKILVKHYNYYKYDRYVFVTCLTIINGRCFIEKCCTCAVIPEPPPSCWSSILGNYVYIVHYIVDGQMLLLTPPCSHDCNAWWDIFCLGSDHWHKISGWFCGYVLCPLYTALLNKLPNNNSIFVCIISKIKT